jgi:hypothetical protein
MKIRRAVTAAIVTGLVAAGAVGLTAGAAQALPRNCNYYEEELAFDEAMLDAAHTSHDQGSINHWREVYNDTYLDAYRLGCV